MAEYPAKLKTTAASLGLGATDAVVFQEVDVGNAGNPGQVRLWDDVQPEWCVVYAAGQFLKFDNGAGTHVVATTSDLSNYQLLDADLTAIAGLAGTSGFLKKTAANTWTLDTSTYLTGNQSITVSGDASGSGSTSIALTLATVATAGTYKSVTIDAKGRVTSGTNPTTLSGYGITDAATSTHVHGNITNAGAIGATANLPVITTTSGVLTTGSFGSTANTFCQGNDSRLSDARTPLAHNQAWSTITSTPTTLSGYGITDAATSTHVHGNITSAGAIGSTSGLPVVTGASGVLTTGTTTGSGSYVLGTAPTLSQPSIDNFKLGYTATATSAGTLTLTASSNNQQFLTGTTTHTVVLPVASTMTLGQRFVIENNSTGTVTVNSSGGNLVVSLTSGMSVKVTCILTSGTTSASWDVEYQGFGTITGTGANVLATSPALTTPDIGAATGTSLTGAGTMRLAGNSGNGIADGATVVQLGSTKYSRYWTITNEGTMTCPSGGSLNLNGTMLFIDICAGSSNQLDVRNSTAAQEVRIHNTYTSSTNYEAWAVDWKTTANVAIVGPKVGSSGTLRQQVFTGIVSAASTPTSTQFASGQYGLMKNTSTGDCYWAYNDGGTLKYTTMNSSGGGGGSSGLTRAQVNAITQASHLMASY